MTNVEKFERDPKDRGGPRRGYGNTDEKNRGRDQNGEDRNQQKPPREFPGEKGPDPDSRTPGRAGK